MQSGKSQQSYVPFVLRWGAHFRITWMCCTIWLREGVTLVYLIFSFRDDGLNNSQAHIALNDHTSLFQETKEHLNGSVAVCHLWITSPAPFLSLELLYPCLYLVRRSRQRLRQRSVSRGWPERLVRLHALVWQWGRGSAPTRGMLGKHGFQWCQETPTTW